MLVIEFLGGVNAVVGVITVEVNVDVAPGVDSTNVEVVSKIVVVSKVVFDVVVVSMEV